MSDILLVSPLAEERPVPRWRRTLRHRGLVAGGVLLLAVVLAAAFGSLFVGDPQEINPIARLMPPGEEAVFGTDHLGRDILARTLHGGRVSLLVGLSVAL